MAINDWDGNGKTDDLYDDYVEYQLYQKHLERMEKEKSTYNYQNHNGGMSTFGAILATILDFAVTATVMAPLDLEGFPFILVLLVLLSVFGTIIAVLFDKLGL